MVNNPESSLPYQVSDDTLESSEAPTMRIGYTGARDLTAISQNQVLGEPSHEVRTISTFRIESNMALILKFSLIVLMKKVKSRLWFHCLKDNLSLMAV